MKLHFTVAGTVVAWKVAKTSGKLFAAHCRRWTGGASQKMLIKEVDWRHWIYS